jgi:hypothetical protein
VQNISASHAEIQLVFVADAVKVIDEHDGQVGIY